MPEIPRFSTHTRRGDLVQGIMAERSVMYYPVSDRELNRISKLNDQAKRFHSYSMSSVAVGITVLVERLLEKQVGEAITLEVIVFVAICALLAWTFRNVAKDSLEDKDSEIEAIKEETRAAMKADQ